MAREGIQRIGVFFDPQSVALVGASRDPGKYGNWLLRNLLHSEYRGKIFPVNARAQEIEGLRSYPSVRELPAGVDIVVISVPLPPSSTSSGIAEKKALKGWLYLPPASLTAQTGMFAGAMLNWLLTTENFGISKVVGLGNKCDITESEILEYLAEEVHTKVIMMYLEGVENGRHFLEVARELSRRKPIVILKGGTTPQGARAALSHTASIAGKDEVFDFLFLS